MSNIRKTKKCCKHAKTSFTRANIRYVKHPKNQKVLQTCENQLYQGNHPICQASEKPKSAANIRKPALPRQISENFQIVGQRSDFYRSFNRRYTGRLKADRRGRANLLRACQQRVEPVIAAKRRRAHNLPSGDLKSRVG